MPRGWMSELHSPCPMLRAYIRKLRRESAVMLDRAVFSVTASRATLLSLTQDLVAVGGDRRAMLGAVARYLRRSRAQLRRWLEGREAGGELARTLLDGAARLEGGGIGHSAGPFRSYVDVSVQMRLLRIAVGDLVSRDPTLLVEPLQLTELLLEAEPQSRAALLAHAQLLIERGDAAGAVEASRRA